MRRSAVVFGLMVCGLAGYAQYSFDQSRLVTDLRILSADSLQGRKTASEGNLKAQRFILNRLTQINIKSFFQDYQQPFTITQSFGRVQAGQGTNLIGMIEGSREETIVISAHFDHVGFTDKGIFNGADDNASGTAALLAIAEYFTNHKPRHRLILAFFDAEEMGLKGSAHFVNSIDLPKERIVLNINMDMISRSDKKELYVCGTSYNPYLRTLLKSLAVPDGLTLRYGHDDPNSGSNDWTTQSDQYSFHVRQIPFLYFGVEDHPDYHKPTDTFEKIDLAFYANSVETILRAIRLLDNSLATGN
jgi:Zn-dependent M28 family amino/carboxypeptidase